MVSIHSRWLWGTGVAVLLLLALTGISVFALRSQPQTAAAEPRSQPIPTWTNTPQAGATADPGAAVATTATAGALATPTPGAGATPSAPAAGAATDVTAALATTATVTSDTVAATATVSLPAAPLPAVEDESPQGILAQGMLLHRYGDYANARTLYARLLEDPDVDAALKREAQYNLARAYLGEGLYGEALATLDDLDAALTGDGADPNQFAKKEQFLRGEALLGQGSYSDAIAAYWRFLDAYPWMGESVQPRIAAAYLALNDPASAAAAFRHAAEVSSDNVSKAHLLEQVAGADVDAGQFAEAVVAYDEILAFAQNAAYRAELQYKAGQALSGAGDGPGAIARWRSATEEAPESNSAYLALVEIVNRNGDFDLYQRGYIDLYADAYEPAIAAFQAYLDATDATDARHASALHRLGQSYLGAGNYTEAIARLDEVISQISRL